MKIVIEDGYSGVNGNVRGVTIELHPGIACSATMRLERDSEGGWLKVRVSHALLEDTESHTGMTAFAAAPSELTEAMVALKTMLEGPRCPNGCAGCENSLRDARRQKP